LENRIQREQQNKQNENRGANLKSGRYTKEGYLSAGIVKAPSPNSNGANPPPNFGVICGEVAAALGGRAGKDAEGGGIVSPVGRALVLECRELDGI
jgi:hypothetical protein